MKSKHFEASWYLSITLDFGKPMVDSDQMISDPGRMPDIPTSRKHDSSCNTHTTEYPHSGQRLALPFPKDAAEHFRSIGRAALLCPA